MKFSLLVAALAAAVSAAPLPSSSVTRDVWDPAITYPHAGAVWRLGETHHVQWSTADAPQNISNGAAIYLRKGDVTSDHPLAEGFDLRKGSQAIVVPHDTKPGSDYRIVLFGDSGNWSEEFTIKK